MVLIPFVRCKLVLACDYHKATECVSKRDEGVRDVGERATRAEPPGSSRFVTQATRGGCQRHPRGTQRKSQSEREQTRDRMPKRRVRFSEGADEEGSDHGDFIAAVDELMELGATWEQQGTDSTVAANAKARNSFAKRLDIDDDPIFVPGILRPRRARSRRCSSQIRGESSRDATRPSPHCMASPAKGIRAWRGAPLRRPTSCPSRRTTTRYATTPEASDSSASR